MASELGISSAALTELMRDTLKKGASFRFQVKGFSMCPFIKDSDVVTIAPFFNSAVRFGWPVAFLNPKSGKLVIHRVVGKANGHFLIKGDSAMEVDGLVGRENIFGYVKKIERNGKDISFGVGPERALLAFFSQAGVLPFLFWCWNAIPFSIRRFIKLMAMQ